MTDNLIVDAAEAAVPGLGEAKAAFALAKVAWPLVAALGVAGALGGAWLYVQHLQGEVAAAKAQALGAGVSAIFAKQGQGAAADAAKIAGAGQAKAVVTVHLEQEHRDAILSAPGSGQALDPALYGALVGGLCAYAADASDPRCPPLRGADPGPLPPAGQGRADPRPDGG